MNKIEFKNITIQNFKSIGPEMHFNFEKHHGLNYIFGKNLDIDGTVNGVGKSTIFVDAILFALYGKTLKNTKNEYIPNRKFHGNKIETFVKLNFVVKGKNYTMISTIKKAGYPVSHRLFENGIEITKSTAPQTRDYLKDEILKCSFGLFVNSIILSASNSYSFFEMNKAQRREYIENIFKITCFGEMLKLIRLDANQLARHILIEQQDQRNYVNNLEQFKKNMDSFKKDKEEEIKVAEGKLYRKKIEKEEIVIYDVSWVNEEDKLKKLNARKKQVKNAIQVLTENFKTNKSMIEHISSTIEKNKEIVELVCDHCKDKLDKEYLIELEGQLQKLHDSNKEIEEDKKLLNASLSKLNDSITSTEQDISKLKRDYDKIKNNKVKLKYINEEIQAIEEEIKTIKGKTNPFKQMYDDTKEKLTQLTEILDKHYSEKTELDILEHVVSDDGAKKYMIKDLIAVLNSLIRQYLEEMGAEFTVHFNEMFDSVFLTNTGECDYTSFSNGERQRINVATLFAFRDILNNTGVESNIFVLDEIIDEGIDEYALKAILGILKRTVEEKGQTIFIVSHRPETSENTDFDNIIKIIKQHSVSKIAEDAQGEE